MREFEDRSNLLNFEDEDTFSLRTELRQLKTEIVDLKRVISDIASIQSPLIGIEQVAKYFGKSQDTIRRWIKEGVINCYKIPSGNGYTYLFSMKQIEEDLEEYLFFN